MRDLASRSIGGRFVNLHSDVDHGLRDVWRWYRSRQIRPWPGWVEDKPHPPPPRIAAGRIGASFIGHASWLVQIGGVAVLEQAKVQHGVPPGPFRVPGFGETFIMPVEGGLDQR